MSTPRLHYIDQLKVLGVYLVVLGHLPLTDSTLMRWIFSFHMPLFFFVSGYLFRPSAGAADMLTKCVRQLLLVMIPYFLINLLFDGFQTALFYPPNYR